MIFRLCWDDTSQASCCPGRGWEEILASQLNRVGRVADPGFGVPDIYIANLRSSQNAQIISDLGSQRYLRSQIISDLRFQIRIADPRFEIRDLIKQKAVAFPKT